MDVIHVHHVRIDKIRLGLVLLNKIMVRIKSQSEQNKTPKYKLNKLIHHEKELIKFNLI